MMALRDQIVDATFPNTRPVYNLQVEFPSLDRVTNKFEKVG